MAAFDVLQHAPARVMTRVAQFTADASHELRTPLALMRSMAEVALRRPRAEADSREVLVQVLGELERTAALVDDLLLLARADSTAHPSAGTVSTL